MASALLRSESRMMDGTALTISSELENSESYSPSGLKQPLPSSFDVLGGCLKSCARGLRTEIGRTVKGSFALLLEEVFRPATLDTSATDGGARSLAGTWSDDPHPLVVDGGEGAPNLGTLPQIARLLSRGA